MTEMTLEITCDLCGKPEGEHQFVSNRCPIDPRPQEPWGRTTFYPKQIITILNDDHDKRLEDEGVFVDMGIRDFPEKGDIIPGHHGQEFVITDIDYVNKVLSIEDVTTIDDEELKFLTDASFTGEVPDRYKIGEINPDGDGEKT